MKRIICVCAAGVALFAAVAACGNKAEKVTAVVAGKDVPVALVVEYANPVAAASVTPEAFVVPGKEIAAVFVADKKPFEKPEGPKPEGMEPGKGPKHEGHHPGGPKPEGKPEGKPEVKEFPVPEIAVQQVADIQTADGKAVKAWKKAVSATEAVPAIIGKPGHHHGKPGHHGHPAGPGPEGAPAPETVAE